MPTVETIARDGEAMMDLLKEDYKRYSQKKRMPRYQYHYRKASQSSWRLIKIYHLIMLRITRQRYLCDFPAGVKIGGGLFINHPYCITIHPDVVMGEHISLQKGITIGQENRGKRQGVPTIGNNVCICPNAIIVGKISVGNDVLIAPGAYVNCDIPDHSIVIGNPCVIHYRENATEGYL